MQKLPRGFRQEAIGVEKILFQLERSKVLFQVSGPVIADAVAKDQVLRAGGRTDRVGLNKTQSIDGFAESGLGEERGCKRVAAEIRKTIRHGTLLAYMDWYAAWMLRKYSVRLTASASFLFLGWFAWTQTQPPKLTIAKVKEGLYEIEGDGGNVAVLVTTDGVLLVDDKFEQDHDAIVSSVKSVTSQPIKYIVTTHHHSDHSGGNGKFISSAEIISTANARANIVEHKQSNAPDNMVPARVVFTDELSVFLGGQEVRAKFVGRGHTNGDAVVYFPGLKTLHTGDLMAGTSPLIDYPGGGSLANWAKTLDAAMMLDFDTVIPGHGKVTDKAGLKAYRDNVDKLKTRVSGLIHEGKSQEEVGQVMTAEYKWAPGSLNMQWSLPGMMTELK